MAIVNGTNGNDNLFGTPDADTINGLDGNDFIDAGDGNDDIDLSQDAGRGNDTVNGGLGNDRFGYFVGTGGADFVNLGGGDDVVSVTAAAGTQIRLTFTSAEIGNGAANDSNSMVNQDGLLALRFQSENGSDGLTGPISRFDDEGITFVASAGTTFDVRDLVSGVQRGNQFGVVVLGTNGADTMTALSPDRPYYFNAGMGNDTITGGNGDDFLVGGAGNDTLNGGNGNDTFIGGGGNDAIEGGNGNDNAIFNITNDGADNINLGNPGDGEDTITVSRATPGEVRLTFTSAEVGNATVTDSGTMANQDAFLAVRMQAEDGADGLTGAISRVEDEMVSFVAAAGVKFDVRDLVNGAQRGNFFDVVTLGSVSNDVIDESGEVLSYYINGGMGNDTITGGVNADFLVGGAGNDTLNGGAGDDRFIGGGGNDTIIGGTGNDTFLFTPATDGVDSVNLGLELNDVVTVLGAPGEFRLTFTSAEIGNGNANDANNMANQDGGLALRFQAEDGNGNLTGAISRFDDEGVTFVAAAGQRFDVRDLVSGVQRGNLFEVVILGTSGDDVVSALQPTRPYYFNMGMGNDTVTGGLGDDFLVGGGGNDTLSGGAGVDTFLGGAGNDIMNGDDGDDLLNGGLGADTFNGGAGVDTAVYDDAVGGIFVNLLSGLGGSNSAFGDTFNSIENVTGTNDGDELVGNNGVNVLRGNGGNDTLIGGLGADILAGGNGTDTASYIDNQGSVFVNLSTGQGFGNAAQGDVLSGIENLVGTAFDDFFIGNSEANVLDGGAGNDTLIGGLGADQLIGGAGNDTASYEDNQGSVVVNLATGRGANNAAEGDTYSGIENAIGTAFADSLIGSAEANILNGRAGRDTLTGGAGQDRFVFDTALGQSNVDTITDFSAVDDTIVLDDSVFAGLALGALAAGAFVTGAAALDGDDRIIYDPTTGALFFDADGSGAGAAIQFATLATGLTLTAADFVVI